MRSSKLIFMLLSAPVFVQAQSKPLPQLGKSPLKEVIAAMTLQEKAKLVVGMGFKMPGMPPPAKGKENEPIDIGGFKLPPSDPDAYNIPEKVPGAAGRLHGISRLGIPSLTVSDGPAGLRIEPIRNNDSTKTFYATAFPVGTLLASTWDVDLVKRVGMAFGSEVRDYGVDILLAPAMNIQRNPLGGRNFEYYSEDPVVSGKISAAIVQGIQSNGVGTSIKHFAANNQESNRNNVNTIVSERALREIYLKGFEITVKEADPWTVMSSYNKVNGVYTSERRDLLTTILKDEWGFKGFVMTDWFGGHDPVAQMAAGNDLIMPGSPNQSQAIVAAVKSGKLSMKQLDENVENILNIVLKSPTFRKYAYSDHPDLQANAAVSRAAAAEGMVLLKNNDNILPLLKGKKLAVFGNTSYDIIAGGTGSGDVNKAYTVSLLQGLDNAGFMVDKQLANTYSTYLKEERIKHPKPKNFFELAPPLAEYDVVQSVGSAAGNDDAAIITIGRNAGEGNDRKVFDDFTLTSAEKSMIKTISATFHALNKKVIVVMNIGGVTDVASWRDDVDAILLAWQPGLEAGNAIADVLSGKVNPSGKLAATFPMSYEDVPSATNFPGLPANKPESVTYKDGIYVGYRYYTTFNVKPAYEFGYGLSYTNFNYSKLSLSNAVFNGKITANITVTNSGNVAGKNVVELYLAAPAKMMDKPAEELKKFAKTRLLQPGESQTFSFVINPSDLASFDTKTSAWVAEAGNYSVKIGASSTDIKQTASFTLPGQLITEHVTKVLVPKENIEEMKK